MVYEFLCFPVIVKRRCTEVLCFCEIKIDNPIRLEYHTEKISINSGEVNRKKIALSERQRVCDFRFTSLEFIYFRSLDIRSYRCLFSYFLKLPSAILLL